MLPSRYRNYWLDLSRKEIQEKEKERKKAISSILALISGTKPQQPKKTKP